MKRPPMTADIEFLLSLLDSQKDPILVADVNHITIYMNTAAAEHYSEGYHLLGQSLLDCHNAESGRQMIEILDEMKKGLIETMITNNEKYKIYMRSVRNPDGNLIGYFERYEPPETNS